MQPKIPLCVFYTHTHTQIFVGYHESNTKQEQGIISILEIHLRKCLLQWQKKMELLSMLELDAKN